MTECKKERDKILDMFKEKQRIDFGKDSRNTGNSTNPNQTFTYDDDGNMTQGYTPAPDNYTVAMAYDAENRLASAEYTDSGSVVHKIEYSYSGNNFLAEIKNYEDSSLVKTIRIVRAGFLPVQERDDNNSVTREYTWGIDMGGGIGGLLNLKQDVNDYSYLYDGKGNVMAVLNNTQSIVASYRYDEFGNLMAKTGTLNQPFMYSTKRYDQSTGTSYYGYRFYSSCTGRWMTRDPLGEAGGINLYGFVQNNPVNFVDPWGLVVITNESGGPLPARGNPGPGRGSGEKVEILIPNNTTVSKDNPIDGVSDVDEVILPGDTEWTKIPGNDNFPAVNIDKDGHIIIDLPETIKRCF
jgi:RHS repeat-associated protein